MRHGFLAGSKPEKKIARNVNKENDKMHDLSLIQHANLGPTSLRSVINFFLPDHTAAARTRARTQSSGHRYVPQRLPCQSNPVVLRWLLVYEVDDLHKTRRAH